MNFGALLGGAAQGFQAGAGVFTAKKYADAYTQNTANAAEEHEWKRSDRNKIDNTLINLRDVAYSNPLSTAPAADPGTFNGQNATAVGLMTPKNPNPTQLAGFTGIAGGYASGGLVQQIPDAVYAGQPQAAYQSGGLASPQQGMPPQAQQGAVPPQTQQGAQPQQQQGAPDDAHLSPSDRFSKALMNTDTLNNPDKLNKMMAIAEANGMGSTIKPYLERYYTAKKTGMIDGAQSLMNGQVDGAMESFARGGLKLDGPPVKVKPDDTADHNWTFSIGGKAQTMNVGDMLSRTVDYQKFQDFQLKQREQTDKERGTTSEIAERDSRIAYNNGARTNEAQARADARRGGGLAGSGGGDDKMSTSVLKRRDDLLDSMSSQPGEDGKPMIDPQRRAELAGISADTHDMLRSHFGKPLTNRQEHQLTDRIASAPSPSDGAAFTNWNLDLKRSFGVPLSQSQQEQAAPLDVPDTAVKSPAPGGLSQAPAQAPAPAAGAQTGALADQTTPERISAPYQNTKYYNEMLGIQRAIKAAKTPEQRANLAMQANSVAQRHAKDQRRG